MTWFSLLTEAGDIERFLNPNCYLGYEFEKNMKERKLSDEPTLYCVKKKKKHDTLQFWAEVSNFRDATEENPNSDTCELPLTILFLPHSQMPMLNDCLAR